MVNRVEIEKKISSYNSAAITLRALGLFALLMGIILLVFSPEALTTDEIARADLLGVSEKTIDKMTEATVAVEMTNIIGIICTIGGIVGIGAGFAINFIVEDLRKRLKES